MVKICADFFETGDNPFMDAYTKPDWFRSVLLTIDVQRDFTVPGAPFLIPGTLEIVPTLQRLLNAYDGPAYQLFT